MDRSLRVADVLADAVSNILESRGTARHWDDIRSTAIAAWALSDVLTCGGAPSESLREVRAALRDAQLWLAGKAKREEGGASWESEGWDTALSIIALCSSEEFAERVDQAAAWLHRIRDPATGAWYDEVWETTLTTIALLRSEKIRKGPLDRARWIEDVMRWLVSIPSKPSGEFICPHYSGFLAWLLAEMHDSRLIGLVKATPIWAEFHEKVSNAVSWLLKSLPGENGGLWSDYTFANAYIALALAKLSRHQHIDIDYALAFVEWLRVRRGQHGGFEDVEDTALAVLALSSVLHHAPYEADSLFARISRFTAITVTPSQTGFLGYSSASADIASSIKAFLASRFPRLYVKDWKWDFRPGRVLFDELDTASRECCLAVFLVTRDDAIAGPAGSLISAPRDNIVFEVGFFAARIGMHKTILIVEQGTKIPADLAGILYIPLKKRGALDAVYLNLEAALRTILEVQSG